MPVVNSNQFNARSARNVLIIIMQWMARMFHCQNQAHYQNQNSIMYMWGFNINNL